MLTKKYNRIDIETQEKKYAVTLHCTTLFMPITSRISRIQCTGEVDLENQLIKLTLYFKDSPINITGFEVLISLLMIDASLLGYESMVIGT